jgi:hypothetical protein
MNLFDELYEDEQPTSSEIDDEVTDLARREGANAGATHVARENFQIQRGGVGFITNGRTVAGVRGSR